MNTQFKDITVHLGIPEELDEALNEYARGHGYRKKAELLREILRDWIKERQKEELEYIKSMSKYK